MSTCMCGSPAETFGGFCYRCAALQTLGLETNASAAEIESTYLTLVKVWHPDRFQSDPKLKRAAEDQLKEINTAHDYLTSKPAAETPRPVVRAPEPSAEEEEPPAPAFIPNELLDEEPEEVRRIMKRLRKRSGSKTFIKVIVAFGGIGVAWLLWISIDFFLSANSDTARPWEEFKAEVARDIHANGLRLWSNASDNLQGSKNDNVPPPIQPPVQEAQPAPSPATKVTHPVEARPGAVKEVHGAKPYLTTGLTPMEVLSILGTPTSSSGEKMFYKGSEIDFRDGRVSGWKIDEKTAPIRVKLWSEMAGIQGLTTFAIGSSKSEVIAVQGTPTLLSDNEFGYGGSVVFFQNDHVSGWKQDPASVRLRVVAH